MYMLSRIEFSQLVERRHEWSLSFYLPTHEVSDEKNRQDPVRLKQLLRQAEEQLGRKGLRSRAIEELLEPLWMLQRDSLFWQFQGNGLAIFLTRDFYRYYRLPIPFEEALLVADRFYLKPLLPLIANTGRYFVLGISKAQVQVFDCTRFQAAMVPMEHMPRGLAEVLRYEDPERQVRYHTVPGGGGGVHGRRQPAVFHGHSGADEGKPNLLRYFQQVDAALQELLRDHRFPVVLYGVEYLQGIYRQASQYPHLAETGITGNPDRVRAQDLPHQAWPLVAPVFEKAQETAISSYQTLAGTGLTTTELREILSGAVDGQVAVLLLAEGASQWGRFDPATREVALAPRPAPGLEDLLDTAALQTFATGGAVYVLRPESMPTRPPAAATLRW